MCAARRPQRRPERVWGSLPRSAGCLQRGDPPEDRRGRTLYRVSCWRWPDRSKGEMLDSFDGDDVYGEEELMHDSYDGGGFDYGPGYR